MKKNEKENNNEKREKSCVFATDNVWHHTQVLQPLYILYFYSSIQNMTISLSQLHLLTSTDSIPNKYYTFQTKKSGRAQVLNNPQKYSPNSPSAKIFNLKSRHERSRFEIDPRVTNSRLNLARILDHYFSHLNVFLHFFQQGLETHNICHYVPSRSKKKENKREQNEKKWKRKNNNKKRKKVP